MEYAFLNEACEKMIKLDKAFWKKGPYTPMDSDALKAHDVHSMQMSASKIAHHVGLKGYIFLVHSDRTPKNKAGSIKLEKGKKYADIIVDSSLSHEARLATLCHEIAHKYIDEFSSNLFSPLLPFELEILTDIATIYLGLGKLMLKGATTTVERYEETKTITTTYNVGYLNKHQLATVYWIWSNMNKLDIRIATEGIDGESKSVLEKLNQTFELPKQKIDPLEYYHVCQFRLNKDAEKIQKALAEIERNLKYVRGPFSKRITEDNIAVHEKLHALQSQLIELKNIENKRFQQMYLHYFNCQNKINQLKEQIKSDLKDRKKVVGSTTKLIYQILKMDEKITLPEASEFEKENCPIDGTVMKFPGEKLLRVTCPTCHYQYMVLTKVPLLQDVIGIDDEDVPYYWKERNKSFKIKNLVSKFTSK